MTSRFSTLLPSESRYPSSAAGEVTDAYSTSGFEAVTTSVEGPVSISGYPRACAFPENILGRVLSSYSLPRKTFKQLWTALTPMKHLK